MLNSRPKSITEQDLLLKHYHQVTVLTEESLAEFYQDVLRAHESNPDSALLNALAGGIYSSIWSNSGSDDDEYLQECARLVERAYALNPNHQDVLSCLAGKCFHFNERDRFFALFEHSKEWMANSPLRLGAWAMFMSFFGEWERGKRLLDRVFNDNVSVPLWLYGVTCLYHFRLGDYEAALEEANKYQIPGLFWGPAFRASILARLGRLEEAQKEFDTLLEWRPDFLGCGRLLMGRFIKEPGLLESVLEGFAMIDVEIARFDSRSNTAT